MSEKQSNNTSKTSKTARVMNLLSKKQENAAPAGAAPTGAAPAAASPAGSPVGSSAGSPVGSPAKPPAAEEKHAAPVPPILSSIGADAAVSGQIKDALEDALAAELFFESSAGSAAQAPAEPVAEAPAAPAPQPPAKPAAEAPDTPAPQTPAKPAAPAPQPPAKSAAEAPATPAPQPPAKPAAPATQAPAAEAPATPAAQDPDMSALIPPSSMAGGYINVMQVLVEEKAPKYIRMFGLCDCRRCTEDVKALALNNLPPKYVVLDQGDMVPRLTFYEGKYSSDITAQLTQACRIVQQTPHHGR